MSDKLIKFQKNLNKIRNTLPLYSVQTVEKKFCLLYSPQPTTVIASTVLRIITAAILRCIPCFRIL